MWPSQKSSFCSWNFTPIPFIPPSSFSSLLRPRVLPKGLSPFCLRSKVLPGHPLPPFCFLAFSSSLLCADGPRMFNLFVARKCEIMAVMSRFTVALLTEGRSARDLPKQHPDKKNLQSKVLPYSTWWLSASTPSFLIFLCWIPSFLFGFSPLFGHLCFCMFKLFVCKKSWYSGRVSFHRRFADCWGLCPGPTQAASEKNRRGLNTWYLFGFACWLLSSRWVPSTWSKLIQLKHYQTYRIQKIVKLLSLFFR